MSDLKPFLGHAEIQLKAEQVSRTVDDAGRQALLLYTVYRKRIRPVPNDTTIKATKAFRSAAKAALVEFASPGQAVSVMDKVCDLLWDTLDESARYVWLRKIT